MNTVLSPVARGWVMPLGAASRSETQLVESEEVKWLRLRPPSKLPRG